MFCYTKKYQTKFYKLFGCKKVPNKRELQQIAFNHLSDIDFKDFMNLYKRCTAEAYSFLVAYTTLALDDPLWFRDNLLERIHKLITTIDDIITDEKLQYDINREAAETLSLLSGKIYKYEYLAGGEILPSNQSRMIEKANFSFYPLRKAFKKQIKTTESQGEKKMKVWKITS